jgi:tetratricopeptide (TPR) repeat protein
MSAIRRPLTLLATGIVLAASLGAIQMPLAHWSNSKPKLQQLTYLPSGDYLRMASLGYRELVADILWLQVIQVMGERKLSEEAGHWLYHAVDRITTLDPKFVRAYEAGSHALCILVVLPEESNRLLEKGVQHNPQEWKLPFLLAINYYFEMGNDEKAAEAMALASRLPGAPESLVRLAAKLFVSAKSPQQAVELLAKVYEETSDENVRKMLEIRLNESIVERDLQILEQAISRYQTNHSRRPERLENLVGPGLLRELPREPFGGRYLYDPLTGNVRSSEVTERMRITVHRRGRKQ